MAELEPLSAPIYRFSPSPSHVTPATSRNLPSLSRRDAIAGVAGGVTSVVLGQPFDLIRVRLQTTNTSSVTQTVRNIIAHEGLLAFYKGAAMPLLAVGACVGIQFATFGSLRSAFNQHAKYRQSDSSRRWLVPNVTVVQNYLAGGVAGIANSVISGPVEHIRTRLQLQPHGAAARLYAGPWDCIRQIFAKAGVAGLFKAYPVAVTKEFQAYGCYFATFEASIAALGSWRGKQRSEMTVLETIPCGALAGIAFWVGSFPIDYVKTRLQNDGFGSEARFKNAWAVVKSTWRGQGMRGFWRGLSPTLVRTSLSSAGCFAMVEQVRKWL